ncbi:MAG: hypothetical protein IK098_00255 [Bacteroidales bacterium]|nr:hypothetical protein [Bacteroidales bacterium]
MIKQKKVFLLPYKCQVVGWFIAGAALLAMVGSFFFGLESTLLLRFQIYGILFLYLGCFLIGFSREKTEDEFTLYLRTSSALAALLVICALRFLLHTVLAILQFSGPLEKDFHDMLKEVFDGFASFGSVLFLYLIMYKIRLSRYNKEVADEE